MVGADLDFGPCRTDFSFSAYIIESHFIKLNFLYSLYCSEVHAGFIFDSIESRKPWKQKIDTCYISLRCNHD